MKLKMASKNTKNNSLTPSRAPSWASALLFCDPCHTFSPSEAPLFLHIFPLFCKKWSCSMIWDIHELRQGWHF